MGVVLSAFLALAVSFDGTAGERVVRRKDAEKVVREGEYTLDGRRVRKPWRSTASTRSKRSKRSSAKKRVKPKRRSHQRKPGSESRSTQGARPYSFKSHSKRPTRSKHGAKSASSRKKSKGKGKRHAQLEKRGTKRAPRARYADHAARRDSLRHASRSRLPRARATPNERDMPFVSVPKSRVRKDPKVIEMTDPARDPEGPSQIALDGQMPPENPPGSTPAVTTPPPAAAAAPLAQAAVTDGPREPDAFDLHSGNDPMAAGGGPAPAAQGPAEPSP